MKDTYPPTSAVSCRRWLGGMLFGLPFAVALFATLWFNNPHWQPEGRTNVGILVAPQVPLPETLDLPQGRWQALTVVRGDCDDACIERVWIMRNAYWALGKEVRRGSDGLLRVGGEADTNLLSTFPELYLHSISEAEMDVFIAAYPQLPQPGDLEVWLVDPLGYVVLRYGSEHTGNNLLTDWRKLMRISQVG